MRETNVILTRICLAAALVNGTVRSSYCLFGISDPVGMALTNQVWAAVLDGHAAMMEESQ